MLHTDSKYVMDGISKWIHGWKRNGWKTADKKPVKNGELWQALDEAQQAPQGEWHWVKGHAGHAENERADELARLGMAPFKPKPRPGCRPAGEVRRRQLREQAAKRQETCVRRRGVEQGDRADTEPLRTAASRAARPQSY